MVVMFDIETTGLDPYNSQVILIGMKKRGEIRQWKLWEIGDEAEMILLAMEEIKKAWENDETIIGYNNLKFDVPFMLERLRILGRAREEHWIIYRAKWFDLYQYLGNDYRRLDLWLSRAGIKRARPEIKGRDIPGFFARKEYDKIEAHNIDDLNTSEKLFKYLKKANPELIPFD
ncbi:MAG: ribonuclease H-like domain-containing protein [Thermoproteota archaeon]